MSDVTTPRLLYRGPADETAETQEVGDQDALERALRQGWRLQRVPATGTAAARAVPRVAERAVEAIETPAAAEHVSKPAASAAPAPKAARAAKPKAAKKK